MSALLLLLLGCGEDPEPVESADPCAEATALGWESFAAGFFATYCDACHASTSPDRRGAPEGLTFDSEDAVLAQRDLIRSAVLERGSMPLGGGVYPADLEQLQLYLDCPPVDLTEVEEPVPDAALRPAWSAQEVAQAVDAATAQGFPHPSSLLSAYLDLMAQGDAECPGDPYQITDLFLYGCAAESGAYFSGITEWREDSFIEGGEEVHGRALVGDAMLLSAAGERMELGGHGAVFEGASGQRGDWDMRGTLIWEGSERAWLQGGVSAWFVASWREGQRGRAFELQGAVSYLGLSLDFQDLRVEEQDCGWSAEGGLLVRDPDGGWFSGDFTPCEPCAELRFEGAPTGEAFCPDWARFGAALSAEGGAP